MNHLAIGRRLPSRWLLRFAIVLTASTGTRAGAQVIPGQGMSRDSRSDVIEYRVRVRNDLVELSDAWAAAWERKDEKKLAATFDRDAHLTMHQAESAGADSIAARLVALPAAGGHASLTVDDFSASGDLAYVSGLIVVQPPPVGAKVGTVEGSYQLVASNDGFGRWRIRSLMLDFGR